MRQRMGKEGFAMTGRTRCASTQVARWCGFIVGAAILAFALKPHAATFTYTNPACTSFTVSGSPPTQLVTCITSSGGGGAGVPTCSPTATPSTAVAQGTLVTLSANCDSSPTSYLWAGGGCAGKTTPTCDVQKSKSATVLYTVNATNASGTSSTAQISITWK